MKQSPAHKEFEKIVRQLANRHHVWRVFGDFCEMAAISFSNSLFKDQGREKRYLEIIGAYEPDEVKIFPALLALTAQGLEGLDCDFLGEIFMQMELSSHWHGQFFTPFHLCQVIGGMAGRDCQEMLKRRGFITVSEPACGAGAMIIGMAAALREQNVNYQREIHVTAVDVDATAAYMCYVQLSLLHIPAVVYVGNTINMEMRSAWYTPAHHLGFWDTKLRRGYALGSEMDTGEPPAPVPVAAAEEATALVAKPSSPFMGQLGFDFGGAIGQAPVKA
jgi:hypothetical protein